MHNTLGYHSGTETGLLMHSTVDYRQGDFNMSGIVESGDLTLHIKRNGKHAKTVPYD